MANFNIYHRRDGRWEGRISRGKKENGKRKYLYVLARTREAVIEKMEEIRQRAAEGAVYKDNICSVF